MADHVEAQERARLQSVYTAIGVNYGWPSWEDWTSRIDDASRHFFFLRVGGQVIGVARLTDHGGGDVEIVTFGLLSEHVGVGLGGEALARVTEAAWAISRSSAGSGRVWLHTSSNDHPNALSNYRARGFEVFKEEQVPTN